MLFIFNLDWGRFDIDQQVVEGNQRLQEMVEQLGYAQHIIFNCASMGAGEWITGPKKAGGGIPQNDLDQLRLYHHQVVERIRQSNQFQANRDCSEMLQTLRANGHLLAVVGTTRTERIDDALKRTRTYEWFDGHVYGYDRRPKCLLGNLTLAALFTTAVDDLNVDYEETLVVADTPEAIEDALPIQTKAVVGYMDPYIPWDIQEHRLKEMVAAGANFTAVGGHTVSNLPWYLGKSAQNEADAFMKQMKRAP